MEEAAATVIPRHEPFIKSLNFKSTPQEPVTEWLTCYEHVASVSTWDGNAKVKFLNLALEGDAKKVVGHPNSNWYADSLEARAT